MRYIHFLKIVLPTTSQFIILPFLRSASPGQRMRAIPILVPVPMGMSKDGETLLTAQPSREAIDRVERDRMNLMKLSTFLANCEHMT